MIFISLVVSIFLTLLFNGNKSPEYKMDKMKKLSKSYNNSISKISLFFRTLFNMVKIKN